MYERKTVDCWRFYCDYGQGWEYETTEYSWKEMKAQRKAYELNSQYPVKIVRGRERKEKVPC